jgi:hypothetical protein
MASRRRVALAFGLANVLTALILYVGVFVALPARWWPVDVPAAILIALEFASGAGLLAGAAWAPRASRIVEALALALGLLAVSLLAVTASWLSGVYGPVGKGGGLILALVAALALPYVVVLPVAELLWLREPSESGK